ncbi:oxygen-independent coproporphyrinogen III oxidase [Jeongeupia naejangsanensis]|uniref:Coproporphyrinogen-III oxidase n=1 Tax=Jeongeupia naejangsanensis TaxID=613195 RepID=A0ABS2BJ13_9NEIS|nr:oxygen-independent coproporphyrinogen III oxidase [Jeongeupia naejangsanensis]MBM3115612.1 oxygen-independent coproporphyrinogen III oxidase [Jeongeupia naejangsanensis]
MNQQQIEFDRALIQRYDGKGPRYTSYPTADRFGAMAPEDYLGRLSQRQVGAVCQPLSLYFHIPFCDTICYYCACNKVITKDRSRAERYLDYLEREMDLQCEALEGKAVVKQLHFGGGTPTFLSDAQFERLMAAIRQRFELAPDGEFSIEIDPRKVSVATVELLARLGLNRMSVGVQDFDPDVQRAVNRVQSEAETRAVIDAARAAGFRSINLDLIYGLPLQTPERVRDTLARVIDIRPERVALYNYAHLPERFPPQRRIDEQALPSPEAKLDILQASIDQLLAAGYVYIGMDHFALPTDELAIAQRHGRLHRNFQGYSTHADCDLMAFGASAIGKVGAAYVQNHRTVDEYYATLDAGTLPVTRGIVLKPDDLMRRAVIQSLMCQFELVFQPFEIAYLVDFSSYFAEELRRLRELEADGLVEVDDDRITVTAKGRLLVRSVAMVFDRYLGVAATSARYSKLI